MDARESVDWMCRQRSVKKAALAERMGYKRHYLYDSTTGGGRARHDFMAGRLAEVAEALGYELVIVDRLTGEQVRIDPRRPPRMRGDGEEA